jgi:hypothetical protein
MEEQEPRSKIERDLHEGRARFDEAGNLVEVEETSWRPIDLGPALRAERRAQVPELLARTDGKLLLYRGPHVAFGESETLKSYFAMLGARAFLAAGLRVLYLDFESNDVLFVGRARQVGIKDGFIGTQLVYMRPDEPLYWLQRDGQLKPNEDAVFQLEWARNELQPSFIVVDGVTECYALHGWNINDGTHAAHFQRVFGSWGNDVASLAIDHAGKDASRGQIGSQHKRAGIDGAQYEFTYKKREGRGGHSIAAIKVTKDRPGAVREFAPDGNIGTIHVTDSEVWIDPPTAPDEEGQKTMQRRKAILDWLREHPQEPTDRLRPVAGCRKEELKLLLEEMVADGLIRREPGHHNAVVWSVVPEPGNS